MLQRSDSCSDGSVDSRRQRRDRGTGIYQLCTDDGEESCRSDFTTNGPFSGTTQVSQYQKGETKLDFTEARDSEWQWHQLGHMQVCTSLQTDNHARTPLSFYRPDALPATQPTASKLRFHDVLDKLVTFLLKQTHLCE